MARMAGELRAHVRRARRRAASAHAFVTSPARGNSFEGFMIEQIVALENLHGSGSGFYFFRTHAGAEIDLLIDRGQTRIGFEFKAGASTIPSDWAHLLA